MLTPELLAFLVAAAARLSGYPEIAVDALPPVQVLKAVEIAALVCPKYPEHCQASSPPSRRALRDSDSRQFQSGRSGRQLLPAPRTRSGVAVEGAR
jgi:hypothetical protein